MALTAHFAHDNLAHHPPNQPQSQPPKRAASRPVRLRSLETSHPPEQDAQINELNILSTFMKQRTYLITLPAWFAFFAHFLQATQPRQPAEFLNPADLGVANGTGVSAGQGRPMTNGMLTNTYSWAERSERYLPRRAFSSASTAYPVAASLMNLPTSVAGSRCLFSE